MKTNKGFGKILLILILAGLAFYYFVYKKNNPPVEQIPNSVTNGELVGKNCFEYDQIATSDAPYSVNEKVEIVILGNKVAMGTKSGNQSGPDMTNGYEGTLTGKLDGDVLNVVYAYKIEGSDQKEKEIYKVKSDSIVKQRYVLKDENGVLIPDTTSTVREMVYKKIDCGVVDDTKNWTNTTDSKSGISFSYPADFGTEFIRPEDWPPVLNVYNEVQTCTEAGSSIDRAGKTQKLTVGGNSYCVTEVMEGAAGSIYTQYAFARVKDGKTEILTFTTHATQCGNYDDPQKSRCETERENFDISKLVDKIFMTFNK